MKRKIGFAVAGVLATLGALLVFLYLKDNRNSSTTAAPPDTSAPADVADDSPDDGPTEEPVAAEPAAEADPAGESGSLTRLTEDNQIVELGQPVDIPADYLQVSFSMSSERALGGRIRPGDTVAVVASFSEVLSEEDGGTGGVVQTTDVLLHKALVADVQVEDVLGATQTTAGFTVDVPEGALNGTNSQLYTISIAVPSTQVERLVYALEYGSIWLAHQPPEAGDTTNGIVTIDSIHEEVSIFIDRDDLSGVATDDDVPAEDLAFDGDADNGESN